MDWTEAGRSAIPAVTAIVGAIGAVTAARQSSGRRHNIKADVETLEKIPQELPAYRELSAHIMWQVEDLAAHEKYARRDWATGIGALICAIVLTVLSSWAAAKGGWWFLLLVGSVPLGLVFAYGTFDSFTKVPRENVPDTVPGALNHGNSADQGEAA